MRSQQNETENRFKLLEHLLTRIRWTQAIKQVVKCLHNLISADDVWYLCVASRWAHLWGERVSFLLLGRKNQVSLCWVSLELHTVFLEYKGL